MRDFFKGWRRKVGCVTLAMALVLLTMWGRSKVMVDELVRITDGSKDMILSLDGTLSCSRVTPPMIEESTMLSLFGDGYAWRSQPADNGFGFDENGNRMPNKPFVGLRNVRRWDWGGITIGSGRMDGGG